MTLCSDPESRTDHDFTRNTTYLPKPFSLEALMQRIGDVIAMN